MFPTVQIERQVSLDSFLSSHFFRGISEAPHDFNREFLGRGDLGLAALFIVTEKWLTGLKKCTEFNED